MADAEMPQIESPKEGESREVLVDDLAETGDYWLSVTDAARVTRRQEITIRRWIAVGELPVRRQRMGLNKRTRHVRASDLAKITPIIDPSAAITGEVGNLDLTNIPHQQAQLMTKQQEMALRCAEIEQTLATFVAQWEVDRHRQETAQYEALTVIQQEFSTHIQT
ncbi:MAG: hypothetical protein H0X24_22750, partial [Ktedonobacterales bacterium]|nr:hypothetical protein [Ktedonobacterales bacterium]